MFDVPTVRPADVPAEAYLVDVRDDEEWAAGHIPESVHLPMQSLLERLDEVPKQRDVVVVCRVGSRSAQVTAYLRQHGWERVRNLDGGVVAWVRDGKPFVSGTGGPPTVL